jgi:hypothetical protein
LFKNAPFFILEAHPSFRGNIQLFKTWSFFLLFPPSLSWAILAPPESSPATPFTSVADPDPFVFGPPGSSSRSISQMYGSGSLYHQPKIVRKPLIPTFLLLLFDFLSLKNDVNVPSKVIRRKTFF